MSKSILRNSCLAFLSCLLFATMCVTVDAEMVTFQVEVESGVAIDAPAILAFDAAAPGVAVLSTLSLTIWSNTDWDLTVSAGAIEDGEGVSASLSGALEMQDGMGSWWVIDSLSAFARTNQSPTGDEGAAIDVPFRFTPTFADAPGGYTIAVEFTVVPKI